MIITDGRVEYLYIQRLAADVMRILTGQYKAYNPTHKRQSLVTIHPKTLGDHLPMVGVQLTLTSAPVSPHVHPSVSDGHQVNISMPRIHRDLQA